MAGWALVLLASCTASPEPAPAVTTPTPPPGLRFPTASAELCREAIQLRLQPLVDAAWPAELVAAWTLTVAGDDAALASGEWSPEQRDLFVAFPQGAPLPPGDYVLTLRVGDARVGHYPFTVRADEAQLTSLSLALTPAGPGIGHLPDGTRIFYLRYAYDAICPGAPLWVTVSREDETICTRSLSLTETRGEGTVDCYREEGAPLEYGSYRATLTLMGEKVGGFTFLVGEKPVETVYRPVCEPLFTALGLTPAGEPYRPLERFEWYTQGIYAGTHCRDLPPQATWETHWYRQGEEVRVHHGVWVGPTEGVLWDSLTGTDAAPFLRHGPYSVTLTLADTTPLSASFRVYPYVRQ
ncbi:MAG: hypothetical protein J7M17_08665 [Anaerolineae bacterium]|nr:hypothetical protein [Anaerolineae bacterium]